MVAFLMESIDRTSWLQMHLMQIIPMLDADSEMNNF